MHRIYLAALVACIVWTTYVPEAAAGQKKRKTTTCVHTGNAWFFKACSKKTKKCWLEYGVQYFMFNWEPQMKWFTFRCVLRYGHKLRKRQVKEVRFTLRPSVNCLGGVTFTWPKILVDKAKRRYKYKCTCTISSLLHARSN